MLFISSIIILWYVNMLTNNTTKNMKQTNTDQHITRYLSQSPLKFNISKGATERQHSEKNLPQIFEFSLINCHDSRWTGELAMNPQSDLREYTSVHSFKDNHVVSLTSSLGDPWPLTFLNSSNNTAGPCLLFFELLNVH